MSQDIRLYESEEVWDQPLVPGQRNLLQAILDCWPQGIGSVLDVGCGDGKLSSRLASKHNGMLVGLDSSAEALARVPFTAIRGDATALPFADASFDLVLSTDALEHMPEQVERNAWRELFRVAAKVVMVAVPFREELLDATARCSQCGGTYHVNWHQRSYDLPDFDERMEPGWRKALTVLAGEPWSTMLPPETHLRRHLLNEWAAWSAAICSHCGAKGGVNHEHAPLPAGWARLLGSELYPALRQRRYCRSHSEILMVFVRDGQTLQVEPLRHAGQVVQSACCIDFGVQGPGIDLEPFCQVARFVNVERGWRAQFPVYEEKPLLRVWRTPGSQGDVHFLLEDASGCLINECVLSDGQSSAVLTLPRPVVAGYYGVLASCERADAIARLVLGEGPTILQLSPASAGTTSYWSDPACAAVVQVSQALWFDPQTLATRSEVQPRPQELILAVGLSLETGVEKDRQTEALLIERDALLARVKVADREAVELQNVRAERDALLARVKVADREAVQLQNVQAERVALLERAKEADCLAVQVQNLTAERDALLCRAQEADRLAVQLQNLQAELACLQARIAALELKG